MPKLLQINVTLNSGSTGRIAEEIGRLAMSQGWESYIAYGREKGTQSKSTRFLIGSKIDFYYHAIQTRIFDRHGLISKQNTHCLVEYIENIKPDIIHIHNIHGYFLNYPILFDYLSTLTTPVAWTMHDCWSFTGHCAYFDIVGCDRWKIECYDCPQKKEYPSSLLFDRSKQNYIDKKRSFNSLPNLTLVPVSDWLANLTKQSFLRDNKIQRIHNGVDISIFKPQSESKNVEIRNKYAIPQDKFMILGVASVWSPRKGLADFKQLNEIIDGDCVIVLVGLNKKQIESLPKGIVGICRTESLSELVGLYSSADLVLNLSREETFGLTTVEGFACGTPSIVFNCTASPELMSIDTGFIVEQGDIAMLNDCIKQVKRQGKSSYTLACRQRAVAKFNKDDRFAEYISLYNQLLSGN